MMTITPKINCHDELQDLLKVGKNSAAKESKKKSKSASTKDSKKVRKAPSNYKSTKRKKFGPTRFTPDELLLLSKA